MITIRRAAPQEAEALSQIAFSAKAHWGYPKHWMEIWRSQFTFRPEYFERNEGWAAVLDDSLIAFYTIEERNGQAWIENLWIRPDHIGRGIGRRLFLHALDLARGRGYRVLRLESDPNAAGFYEKMGMYRIGERVSEIEGRPRILPLMEIEL